MSRNANNASGNPTVSSSGVAVCSQIVDASATSDARTTCIEIEREVTSRSVAKYVTRYANTLEVRLLSAMIFYGANLFMLDRRNVRQRTDIGA